MVNGRPLENRKILGSPILQKMEGIGERRMLALSWLNSLLEWSPRDSSSAALVRRCCDNLSDGTINFGRHRLAMNNMETH